MLEAYIVYEEEAEERFSAAREILLRILKEFQIETEELCIMDGRDAKEYTKKLEDDSIKYIFSFDMAGFQMNTILEQPAYNLFKAIQMHIVVDERYFALYANKEFALNLFFFVPGRIGEWKRKYPEVLNFIGYEYFATDWTGKIIDCCNNREKLNRMVIEFMKEISG